MNKYFNRMANATAKCASQLYNSIASAKVHASDAGNRMASFYHRALNSGGLAATPQPAK